MSSRQKSSRPEVQFSPPRSARQSKPKAINGSSSERRRPHLSHSQGDVVTNGDRHNPSGGPALHNQEVAHPRDRRQDWAQNHNYHDAVHDNGYRTLPARKPRDHEELSPRSQRINGCRNGRFAICRSPGVAECPTWRTEQNGGGGGAPAKPARRVTWNMKESIYPASYPTVITPDTPVHLTVPEFHDKRSSLPAQLSTVDISGVLHRAESSDIFSTEFERTLEQENCGPEDGDTDSCATPVNSDLSGSVFSGYDPQLEDLEIDDLWLPPDPNQLDNPRFTGTNQSALHTFKPVVFQERTFLCESLVGLRQPLIQVSPGDYCDPDQGVYHAFRPVHSPPRITQSRPDCPPGITQSCPVEDTWPSPPEPQAEWPPPPPPELIDSLITPVVHSTMQNNSPSTGHHHSLPNFSSNPTPENGGASGSYENVQVPLRSKSERHRNRGTSYENVEVDRGTVYENVTYVDGEHLQRSQSEIVRSKRDDNEMHIPTFATPRTNETRATDGGERDLSRDSGCGHLNGSVTPTESHRNCGTSYENVEVDRGTVYENAPGHLNGSVTPTVTGERGGADSELPNGDDDDDSIYSDSSFDDDYDEDDDVQELVFDQVSLSSQISVASSCNEYNLRRKLRFGSICSHGSDGSQTEVRQSLAMELLDNERAHVQRLHFLTRVVLVNLRVLSTISEVTVLPADVIKQIFSNLDNIYTFHATNMLPRLEEKVASWSEKSHLGDIFKEMVPFFKLYAEFAENFRQKLELIDKWMKTSKAFSALVNEVQKLPECRCSSLQDQLRGVLNHVGKFYICLKEYAENTDDDSVDKKEAEGAMENLNSTVQLVDRAIGRQDRIRRLTDVQQRIEGYNKIVRPNRYIVAEGAIKSVSASTGKKMQRYMFLFNDALILCGQAGVGIKHQFRVFMDVDRLQIYEGDNLEYPNTFYVQNRRNAVELYNKTPAAKRDWLDALRSVMDAYTKEKLTNSLVSIKRNTIKEEDIGRQAPKIDQGPTTKRCNLCATSIGTIRKKHYCDACGFAMCSKCSSHKVALEYADWGMRRVCDECYMVLRAREIQPGGDHWSAPQVTPLDNSKICGYAQLSMRSGKSLQKRYLLVHESGILYCFRNKKGESQPCHLPLRRFKASHTARADCLHKPNVVKLASMRKTYFIQFESSNESDKWLRIFNSFAESDA